MRTVGTLLAMVALLVIGGTGCGRKHCASLAKQACELAPGTPACERATRMTSDDECEGFLKDPKRYVELMNLKVTTPGVQPPAPPAPPPAADAQAPTAPDAAAQGGAPAPADAPAPAAPAPAAAAPAAPAAPSPAAPAAAPAAPAPVPGQP